LSRKNLGADGELHVEGGIGGSPPRHAGKIRAVSHAEFRHKELHRLSNSVMEDLSKSSRLSKTIMVPA